MEQKFDNFYMTIAQEAGGIQGLFDSMFSFLQRKTDFYYEMMPGDKMGFPPGVNLKIMYEIFQKYQQDHYKKHPKIDPEEYNKQLQLFKDQQEKQNNDKKQENSQKIQQDSKISQQSQNTTQPKQEIPVVRKEEKQPEVPSIDKKVQDISTYNGGKTSDYSWAQTVTDVTFSIKLEQNTKPKDIQIEFKTKNIFVKVKNEVKIQGELYDKIHVDESFWSIEDGCLLVVNMEKGVENIWKTIIIGDEEIDATKVENSKRVDEFDNETQGALRKIMHEQNLKLNGLPTTEEQQQLDFMKKAWDADGSPFKGTPFDPSKLNMGNNQQPMNM